MDVALGDPSPEPLPDPSAPVIAPMMARTAMTARTDPAITVTILFLGCRGGRGCPSSLLACSPSSPSLPPVGAWVSIHNCQPGGGGGQVGSGCHPGGGVHPAGAGGHPGGGLSCIAMKSLSIWCLVASPRD